jgi:hypothetical protein
MAQGFMYLVVVMDWYSRLCVELAVVEHTGRWFLSGRICRWR